MLPEEIDDNDVTLTENGGGIFYHDLCEIINARVEELLRLILFRIPRTDYARDVPSGLVLTGGCSNLPGITELGYKLTGLPVRVGTPLISDGYNGSLREPEYAASVGLVCWKMKNQGSQDLGVQGGGLRILSPKLLSYFGSRN